MVEVQDFRTITHHFEGIYRIYLNLIVIKLKDVSMETVGLGKLGYQTDHAQKSPQTLALMQARLYARLQKMLFCTNEDGQKHECGIVSDSLCPFYFFNVLTTPEEKPAVDMSDISSEDSGSNNTVYNNVYL